MSMPSTPIMTVILGIGLLLLVPPLIWFTPLVGPKTRVSIVTAIRNLWLHKLRSFLSVLGIIIGTGAVISLMAFGEGSMQDAVEAIKRQGATNIIVMSVKPTEDASGGGRRNFVAKYGLTDDDHERFRTTIPDLVASLPLRIFPTEIRPVLDSTPFAGRVVGTTARYSTVFKLEGMVEAGRFIDDQDEVPVPRNVAVIGSNVARTLFPGQEAIGKSIKFAGKDRAFIIVGVLKDRTPNTSGAEIESYNDDVYIPLAACRALLGELTIFRQSGMRGGEIVQLNQIILTVKDDELVRPAAEMVRAQLEMYHDRARKDWDIKIPLDKLIEAQATRDRYRILLAFIAGISLLVGGIGIMNIMLATVTERTREIGIRRALGAKRSDITFQFLVEALVQTTVGGLIGVAMGFACIAAVPPVFRWLMEMRVPVAIHVPSVFIAFFVAGARGVIFGWYPSRRAAGLDPIEALRHE